MQLSVRCPGRELTQARVDIGACPILMSLERQWRVHSGSLFPRSLSVSEGATNGGGGLKVGAFNYGPFPGGQGAI
ncbi:hypothetical protein GCM10027567_16680 [Spongiibacter taiwanensis]